MLVLITSLYPLAYNTLLILLLIFIGVISNFSRPLHKLTSLSNHLVPLDIGKGFLTELRFLFSFLSSRLENHRLIILSSSTTQISLSILWYSLFSCTHFSIFLHSSDAILCQSLRARAITFFSFAFIRLFRPFKPCLPVTFITTSFSTTLFRKTLYYRLAKFYHFKVNSVNISLIGPQKESRISCYNFRRRKFLYLVTRGILNRLIYL